MSCNCGNVHFESAAKLATPNSYISVTPTTEASPLEKEFTRLTASVDAIETSVEICRSKFSPVLVPEPEGTISGTPTVPRSSFSAIGEKLENLSSKLDFLNNKLRNLLNRNEL